MGSLQRLLVSAVAVALLSGGATAQMEAQWESLVAPARLSSFPEAFQQPPPVSPDYMVDNTGNRRGVAPIKGTYNGPVWQQSGSFEGYMKKLVERKAAGLLPNSTTGEAAVHTNSTKLKSRQGGSFWVPELGPLGKAPHAGDGYVFYRNVLDYGADNTGATNTEEAINAAIIDGDRCGEECGNTFVLGALIYFPPGTYKVCTPIIQYYLTQFVGDPNDRPIIKGCDEFTGIALMDVDPYVPNQAQPDGTGVNWYINQNQFFRQIRNFVFDLTEMPAATDEHDQKLVPTGIHWQVSQACSLQNLLFRMPTASSGGDNITHVGVFTENGSGGFVSDLEFEGGAIGWRVGSQQYTATSLKFRNCITAVQMVWDWGFNWHKIDIEGGSIAFNISGRGGIDGQGIGSVSIIDSTVSNVPIGILTNDHPDAPPNIVIDNTAFNNVGAIVVVEGGETLLAGGSTTVDLWAHGRRYVGGEGERATGHVQNRPSKPEALLDGSGKLFTRLRPQYENVPASSFLVATQHGCSNDGTGDNTAAINAFLSRAASAGQVAYFPAGIYSVQGTVTFPTGSKIQGSGWSQIQATGSYFADMENPKVVVRVGEEGDVGTMEIVDMLFTAKGATAGAIMMEWNIHESSQGAAGLWDSHIRVGGGIGTDLDIETCPKFSQNDVCICVSMLLHITTQASGYFENFWAWVADHDNDYSLYWELDSSKSQIALFGARGVLIESQGPVWIYGSGSEHVIFYQYETLGAKDVYLGHIQTESPYMQPKPVSPMPMEKALGVFPGDPDWSDCTKETCEMAWGLRILDSEGIMVHSAGLYSWFNDYTQGCLGSEDCQERAMEVRGSKDVSIFNIFSKAVEEIGTSNTNSSGIRLDDGNQQGYTSEISFWFPEDGEPGGEVIYVGPEVYETHTAQCAAPPCVFVMPPTTLPGPTTISVPPYTTELEVGASQDGSFIVSTTTVTITIGTVVTNVVPVSNHNITRGESPGAPFWVTPSITFPPTGVPLTKPDGQVTTRNVTLPPWPQILDWPGSGGGGSGQPGPTTRPPNNVTGGPPPTITFPDSTFTSPPLTFGCPSTPARHWIIEHSAAITLSACNGATTLSWDCPVTATVEIDEPTTVDFSLGCTRWTGTSEPIPTMTEFPPGSELEWVEEEGDDDDTSTCELWFFFICISWGRIKISGWRWNFPGPIVITGPPPIKWPPGVTLKGKLPGPWPPITIGRDGKPTLPPRQPTNCETQEAELCGTSTFISTTVTQGTVSTITQSATTTCETIRGCVLPNGDYDTTSKTGRQCGIDGALRTAPPGSATWPHVTAASATSSPSAPASFSSIPASIRSDVTSVSSDAISSLSSNTPVSPSSETKTVVVINPTTTANDTRAAIKKLDRRADDPPLPGRDHALIWPRKPGNAVMINAIRNWLRGTEAGMDNRANYGDFKEVKANGAGDDGGDWVGFFFVVNMRTCDIDQIEDDLDIHIADVYGLYEKNKEAHGELRVGTSLQPREMLNEIGPDPYWEISEMSTPPEQVWDSDWPDKMYYAADDSFGAGQIIFSLEDGIWTTNSEFAAENHDIYPDGTGLSRGRIVSMDAFDWGENGRFDGSPGLKHGTQVVSKITGWKLGLAKRADIYLASDAGNPDDYRNRIWPRHLEKWVRIYNQVKKWYAEDGGEERYRGRIVVTSSTGFEQDIHSVAIAQAMYAAWSDILEKLEALGVVIIVAAHNQYSYLGDSLDTLPDRFGDPSPDNDVGIESLVVVGSVDAVGRIAPHTPYADWLVMAPGYSVSSADNENAIGTVQGSGNSVAAPLVAGLVAYWRGLPNLANNWAEELKSPANVKKLLKYMQRFIMPENLAYGLDETKILFDANAFPRDYVPHIWSGTYEKDGVWHDCLVEPDGHPSCPQGSLSALEPFGAGCQQPGTPGSAEGDMAAQAGGVCVVRGGSGGGGGGGGGGPGAIGDPVTFTPGPASPTCVPGSPGCGTLCTGFYCVPSPTGVPPDHWDPEDPAHQPTSARPTTRPGGPVTTPPISLPPLPSASSCASYTPTTVCNGSGGRPVCITSSACAVPSLPTLSATSDAPYSGSGCASYTSTTICNGSGGRSVCITDNICVATPPPCPAYPVIGTPVCPPEYPNCLKPTTTILRCGRPASRTGAPAIEARATSAPTLSPGAHGSFHDRRPKPPPGVEELAGQDLDQGPRALAKDEVDIANVTGVVAHSELLGVRQNAPIGCGGSENGGCDIFNICAEGYCATIIQMSCVQAFVHIHMHPIDTEVVLDVFDDGEQVCSWSIKCLTIEGSGCLEKLAQGSVDCKGGGRIEAWDNGLSRVRYKSGKYDGYTHSLYLGQDGGDQYSPCSITIRWWALCIDSDWSASAGLCRQSSLDFLDEPPRRLQITDGT